MSSKEEFDTLWRLGDYRRGSTCQRLIPFLKEVIPVCTLNDYGSGTGRAEIPLLEAGYNVNMVDFSDEALEEDARNLIGDRLTYTIAPLDALPSSFPHTVWGICINVLMLVEPRNLDKIMEEMRRTCDNLVIEVYDMIDRRLGKDRTTIKGTSNFWAKEMSKYWPEVEEMKSPEHPRRYIVVGRSD